MLIALISSHTIDMVKSQYLDSLLGNYHDVKFSSNDFISEYGNIIAKNLIKFIESKKILDSRNVTNTTDQIIQESLFNYYSNQIMKHYNVQNLNEIVAFKPKLKLEKIEDNIYLHIKDQKQQNTNKKNNFYDIIVSEAIKCLLKYLSNNDNTTLLNSELIEKIEMSEEINTKLIIEMNKSEEMNNNYSLEVDENPELIKHFKLQLLLYITLQQKLKYISYYKEYLTILFNQQQGVKQLCGGNYCIYEIDVYSNKILNNISESSSFIKFVIIKQIQKHKFQEDECQLLDTHKALMITKIQEYIINNNFKYYDIKDNDNIIINKHYTYKKKIQNDIIDIFNKIYVNNLFYQIFLNKNIDLSIENYNINVIDEIIHKYTENISILNAHKYKPIDSSDQSDQLYQQLQISIINDIMNILMDKKLQTINYFIDNCYNKPKNKKILTTKKKKKQQKAQNKNKLNKSIKELYDAIKELEIFQLFYINDFILPITKQNIDTKINSIKEQAAYIEEKANGPKNKEKQFNINNVEEDIDNNKDNIKVQIINNVEEEEKTNIDNNKDNIKVQIINNVEEEEKTNIDNNKDNIKVQIINNVEEEEKTNIDNNKDNIKVQIINNVEEEEKTNIDNNKDNIKVQIINNAEEDINNNKDNIKVQIINNAEEDINNNKDNIKVQIINNAEEDINNNKDNIKIQIINNVEEEEKTNIDNNKDNIKVQYIQNNFNIVVQVNNQEQPNIEEKVNSNKKTNQNNTKSEKRRKRKLIIKNNNIK